MHERLNGLPDFSDNQNTAIDFALDRSGSAWFMPPGMGKTRSWLETIKETGERTLVVAPKLVARSVWPAENKKWGYNFSMRMLHGPQKHLRGKEMVSLITYDTLPWLADKLSESRETPYKFVVFDEVSKIKNHETKRFTSFNKIAHKFDYKSGGTGTPVGAHLKDLWAEMYVCDGGKSLGDDYKRFERRYFSTDDNPNSKILTPYHDAEDEILSLMRKRAISFDINDLDMPPLQHIPHYLDLPEAVRGAYEQMHDDSVVDGEDLEIYAANAAVRSGKLRQMASGGVIDIHGERKYLHDAKAEHLKAILEEHDGRPVMVFFEFLSDYQSICRVLGREVPALYGRTKARDAQRFITQWNAGKLPVLALHPRSAAYGLNLQDSGNVIVWYTVPWSFEMINQGTARLWRQGQKNKVLCYYLIVADTEDERVFARVEERAGTHDRVMKGLL